jgi:flagellar motor switch protein FliN
MKPAEIDALVASAQAAKAAGQPLSSLAGLPAVDAPAPRAPQLTEFEGTSMGNSEVPIGMLLDLSLPVHIELGRSACCSISRFPCTSSSGAPA